jgi:16S rRNA (guanine966-N2)-methyltransferase
MRVIGGAERGRPLLAPKTKATRPTSDLIRGVIFNLLEQEDVVWDRVLDLYAGSGALGIEALSRGAATATFVEHHPAACRAIAENLRRLGLSDRATVLCQSVRRALPKLGGRYSIILLDPPYADPDVEEVLTALAASPLVGPETVIVLEHARQRDLALEGARLRPVKVRCHGDTCVTLFRRGE